MTATEDLESTLQVLKQKIEASVQQRIALAKKSMFAYVFSQVCEDCKTKLVDKKRAP